MKDIRALLPPGRLWELDPPHASLREDHLLSQASMLVLCMHADTPLHSASTSPCTGTSSLMLLLCMHAGTDVFCNPPELLHITLFHTSHPHDPRPNALDKEESAAHAKQPIPQRRGPTDAEIRAEMALMPGILGKEALTSVRVWL